ncbi:MULTISPECIES: alpha/beta hydrolase [unclassified Clostridium]|uniref:alpha/beta hydrolase n=1 Tax=unclassified Clostridium TaxID=2614128 RepID=UPI000297A795|nr:MULTISPECIES: alpha/beta hydrolase [unclassified Clostridium]EKQ50872.1 MAG: putative hydrolase or acyltransferase of alpha/beta superfamily [Clostridium sp. Maddingley MBC34-26]
MKLLWHSNGLHKVEKDKVSKGKVLKKIIIFFVALLVVGFIVQNISNFVDNSRLKSKFKFARIDGKKMEYKIKTGGDYTVVFDGAIGNNMYEWDEICKSLEEKKISTFVYNRRGYGFNEGGDIRTPEDQAKDLKLLLRKAGAPEPYILVGEEYGSLVTTNFIRLYSDSVAGVVLVDPISEEEVQTKQFNQEIKDKYYRSTFEEIGTNFGLTSLLSKMGLTIENSTFKEHLSENELDEFNSFKNKTNYRQAVSNELENLYKGASSSQVDGLLGNKPLYLITDKDDDPITKIGNSASITVYKEEISGSPISVLDPDAIVNGVNSVIKDAKKLAKKS